MPIYRLPICRLPVRLLATTAVACALVLAAGCTDDEKAEPQPQAIATAKLGQVVSVIGDGTALGAEEGPAARSAVAGPAALAEGTAGLLIGQQNNGEIIEISSQGQVRSVANAASGVERGALSSLERLSDGTIATLEGWERAGTRTVRLGRLGADGKLVEWARADVPAVAPRGQPGLTVASDGGVIAVWDGLVWTLRKDKFVAGQIGVTSALRAVADGEDLLVATNDKIYRVRDGKPTWSAAVRPASGRGQGGIVTSIAPDGAGGAYVAMTDPAVVNHVTAQGTVEPVASGVDAFDCKSPVGGSALDHTPLKDPQALLLRSGQLLIADRGCNRVFAVGVG